MCEERPMLVPCDKCGGEGCIYYGHPNDPDPENLGPCLRCDGTGLMLIETEAVTFDDLAPWIGP
jgi:hypothetical protein